MSIRVTSGKLRGRSIESPPRSKDIRPTTALIRESFFNKFQADMMDCRFLDLFAGSGIMGIEALSRYAGFVLAVEQDPVQAKLIKDNYEKFGLEKDAKILTMMVEKLIDKPCKENPFDLIFADPPYGYKDLPGLFETLTTNGWLIAGGSIMIEHGKRDPDIPGFTRKDYGDTSVSVLVGWNPDEDYSQI